MAIRTVKPQTGIKGTDIVLRNLQREIQNIENRSLDGLIEAANMIRRDMDKTPPLIPVDLGNLRASWSVTPLGKLAIIVGFSANYAVFVHENVGAHFNRPGSGAKFFEASLKRNKNNILKIIQRKARIK
jgi:hypothetical protein